MKNSKIRRDNLITALEFAKVYSVKAGYHPNSGFKAGLEENLEALRSGGNLEIID